MIGLRKMCLNDLAKICHSASRRWWYDEDTGQPIQRETGTLFMLMVSEIAEAMEGDRKNLQDSHLPHRKAVEVELADCLIRIFDFAGKHDLDLDGAVQEKMAYNAHRQDHTKAARQGVHGKKY